MLLLPWLIVDALQIVVGVIAMIVMAAIAPIFLAILWLPLISIALGVHWWLVVYAYNEELKDREASPPTDLL